MVAILKMYWRSTMDRIQNRSQNIIYNLAYLSFVFLLVYLFGLGINLDLNLSMQLIAVVIGSFLVKFFLFNPIVLYILLALAFLAGIIVNHFANPFIIPLFERMYFLMENIINNLKGSENILDENILLYWVILVLIVSLVNAIILFKIKNIYLLLPIYIGAFLFYWYNFYDHSYWVISIFFLVFLVLMGLYKFSKGLDAHKENDNFDKDKLYRQWMETAAKYSILIVVIALVLPKNYNYIRWPWLQQRVYRTFPFVEDLRSYNTYTRGSGEASLFNFSMTGASDGASRLGGPVNLSDKKIMTVYSNEGNYLRGNVQHTYTGNEWQSIKTPRSYHPLRKNFSDWPSDYLDSYYRYATITIQNHHFASTTLFSPFKAVYVDLEGEGDITLNRDYVLEFPNGIYDGETYRVWAQKPLSYGDLLDSGIKFYKDGVDNIDIYLQYPEDRITSRTKDLVDGIVSGYSSDYDKALALEDYLRNNFDYNLSPDIVPNNQEFIDYFLFEEQEGYCTYYATAMTIMLRLEGIPSRYVEGYLALDKIDDGRYEVRHNNAHAWVEAFIEPVGWIQFEPTPAFSLPLRVEDRQDDEDVAETPDSNEFPDSDSVLGGIIDRPDLTDDSDIGFGGAIRDDSTVESNMDTFINLVLLGLIAILPIRFLIGLFKSISKEAKIKKLSYDKRIIYLYGEIVNLIALLGYPQENGETHHEYAQRVGYKFYYLSEADIKGFNEITDIFVKSKYGGIATDEDVLVLEEFKNMLEIRLKNYLGRIRYYYNKYVKQ